MYTSFTECLKSRQCVSESFAKVLGSSSRALLASNQKGDDEIVERRPNPELHAKHGGEEPGCLLGGGRRGEKGPRKSGKKSGRRRDGNPYGMQPGHPKAKMRAIGPSMAMSRFMFSEKIHSFRFETLASAFKTKTNLTGSQIKGAAAPYGFALAWSFTDLPQATNLVALFDQFRIRKVVLRLAASKNTNATGAGSILYVVEDYDNSNLLTSVAAAQAYQSCQTVHGSDTGNGEGAHYELTPCIPVPSLAGNTIVPHPWQDCAVTTNSHYGLKGWYQTSALTDPVWDVDAQYWIDMINTQ